VPPGLDGVLPSPLPGCGFISRSIGLVDMCDLGDERVIGVGVCEHGADGEENFADRQSRAPLVSEDVETDAAIRVDVGVIDASCEVDLGRLEGVICGKVDGQEEDAA